MTRMIHLLLAVVLGLGTVATAQAQALRVTDPKDNAAVAHRQLVSGEVTGPTESIWVVIRPTATGDYWVQPPVRDLKDGKWSTTVYFGRPGSVDMGAAFELRAVVDPAMTLKEGQVLKSWPSARLSSPVVRVERSR